MARGLRPIWKAASASRVVLCFNRATHYAWASWWRRHMQVPFHSIPQKGLLGGSGCLRHSWKLRSVSGGDTLDLLPHASLGVPQVVSRLHAQPQHGPVAAEFSE